MGRIAAHTQEQVFEAAEKLAAESREVTPTTLREVLGRGSFSTLGKHLDAWRQARKIAPALVTINMPENVRAAFARCWQAVANEAGREITAIREKADAEIQASKRRLDEALAKVDHLRTQLEAASDREKAKVEEAATAKAAAARLSDQLKEQKLRSVEVIGKLEKGKQALEADLSAARKDARASATGLGRAQGELEALRTEVARLNDTIRSLTGHGEKKDEKG